MLLSIPNLYIKKSLGKTIDEQKELILSKYINDIEESSILKVKNIDFKEFLNKNNLVAMKGNDNIYIVKNDSNTTDDIICFYEINKDLTDEENIVLFENLESLFLLTYKVYKNEKFKVQDVLSIQDLDILLSLSSKNNSIYELFIEERLENLMENNLI